MLRDEHGWTHAELVQAIWLQDEVLPLKLHEGAFAAVIDAQGSDEQRALWLPRCRSYEVLGCYAQTELAHGSNVRGLETVARYDRRSQQFVVSTPRPESAKWWVGGMGVLANHALVQAILELPGPAAGQGGPSGEAGLSGEAVPSDDGQVGPAGGEQSWHSGDSRRMGPHLFIVPIRSATSHRPLAGVTVGDIGPKAYGGFGYMDNGYLRLDEVRIPRDYMLQRHAQLAADGSYTPAKHAKLAYGSMVALRAGISLGMGWHLARAVTVAVRYCAQRRQFAAAPTALSQPQPHPQPHPQPRPQPHPHPQEEEGQVLGYASTAMRLHPLLAQAYAYIFAGRTLLAQYGRMQAALHRAADASLLPEVHALAAALKAKATWDCVRGIEEARKAMGGHGFSHLAGVGSIFADQTPAQTFEGDNYVIAQQTARALVKALGLLQRCPAQQRQHQQLLPDSMQYVRLALDGGGGSPQERITDDEHLHMLHMRAAHQLAALARSIARDPGKPWVAHSWTCARLAAAHADVFVVAALPRHTPLAQLHVLATLVAALPELLEAGAVATPAAARALREAYEAAALRLSIADAVRLTDAFGFHDCELPGVVGAHDGAPYPRMLAAVVDSDVTRGPRAAELHAAALAIATHHRQPPNQPEKARI